jgi:predicted DNA-binding protein YlxM (UPF0122 family)
MENKLYLTELYDYYKELLTDKEQVYFEEYYFEDLTQEEIADNHEVSKNAISKSLIEVKDKLETYESKLKLYSNKEKIKNILSNEEYEKIEDYI